MRAMNPGPTTYGPATIIEPANHNTGPAERGRGPSAEMRPLPDNVVPMPDRFERLQTAEAQPNPSASAQAAPPQPVMAAMAQPTSMELAQAALARAQASSASASHTAGAALAVPPAPRDERDVRAAALPTPVQLQSPAAIEQPSSAQTDLSTLLRTVAVTQMRVAHDVAEAVQRIEGRHSNLQAVDNQAADRSNENGAGEYRTIEGKAIEMKAGEMKAGETQIGEAVADLAQPIEDGAPVREQQAWREAGPAIHDDMKRAFSGRGLAHDPALDDAGSIAARYAPTQRPH